VYLLAKWLLLGAGALTAFYVSGFVFNIFGDPAQEFGVVLDLSRSVAMTTWIVWAVIWSAGKILSKMRCDRLGQLAQDLDVDDGG
jgi:hypothetical protein